MKIPAIPVALGVLMISITVGILLGEPKIDDSAFVFGSAHEHASISLIIFGDSYDFTTSEYQLQSKFIHLENFDGYVIHRHSTLVTLGYFFETINFKITPDCIIIPDKTRICSNNDYSLKFYINGKKVNDLRDYLIFDGDLILISYGAENQDQISKQLEELKSRGFPFKVREKNDAGLPKF